MLVLGNDVAVVPLSVKVVVAPLPIIGSSIFQKCRAPKSLMYLDDQTGGIGAALSKLMASKQDKVTVESPPASVHVGGHPSMNPRKTG